MPKSQKLKIAMFSDSFFPSIDGVVTSIATTALELSKQGHSILVFAPKPRDFSKVPEISGFEVVWVAAVSLLQYDQYRVSPPFSLSAQKKFKAFAPDVVHCHTPFSLGWMGLNLGKKFKVPVVATYHTLLPNFLMYLPIPIFNKTKLAKQITWHYTNFFYKKADLVTTPTEPMAIELKKHGCPALAISNPVQFSLFNRFSKTKKPDFKKEFRLVYFGRLSFEKNIEVLIEALKILLSKKIPAKLVLVGDGPAKQFLQGVTKNLALEKHVEFTGILRKDDLAKKVASCHVMVTASTIETQGLTILEGMSAGLPCVGTDFLGIPDAVKENQNGFLFPAFKAGICAQKLEKIFKSKKLYQKLAVNSLKTGKKFSSEQVCLEWEKTYRKLAKKR
ncbi:MAG: glycosyltransferase [Candidatus Micrarchaeota archaeon]